MTDKLSAYISGSVLQRIGCHFADAVAQAQRRYRFSSSDEDSLTGALGASLVHEPEVFQESGCAFQWQTYYNKIRGRGRGAPEKRLGADGIFQIEVTDANGKVVFRKGLLFQAKKGWRSRDPALVNQVRDMLRQTPSSIVVDYNVNDYRAVDGNAVLAADGNPARLAPSALKGLGEVLSVDFLQCTQGQVGLTYDAKTEQLRIADIFM